MSAPNAPLQGGPKLGRYELVVRLGIGGMGEVWAARQKSLGGFERMVAVKRILPRFASDPAFVQRFAMEAQIAAVLSHPNIVQIHDLEEDRGEIFIAMELVRGETLQAVIRRAWEQTGQPVSAAIGAGIMARVCRALHHAHTHVDPVAGVRGLVHRDVAPANVLVGFRGEVKVVDFGIARALNDVSVPAGPVSGDATGGGSAASGGRVAYMSPEQARGEELDARSDIFAAGIVLWELLTGMRLFGGMESAETRRVVSGPEPARLAIQARPGLDPELAAIAQRALEKDRARRYGDAAQMAADLEAQLVRLGVPPIDEALVGLMDQLFRDQKERWAQIGALPQAARAAPSPALAPAPTPAPTPMPTPAPTPALAPSPTPTPTPSPSPSPALSLDNLDALDLFDVTLPEQVPFSDVTDPDEVRNASLLLAISSAAAQSLTPGEPQPGPAEPAPSRAPAPSPERGRYLPLPFDIDAFYQSKAATAAASWSLDVALLWGDTVISSTTFTKSQDVVLADSELADFAIPREVLGSASFKLVHGTDTGFVLDLSNPAITGDVLVGDKVRSLAELTANGPKLPIKGALRARLKLGEFTLLVAHVPAVSAVVLKRSVEAEPFYFMGLSALVQLAFLIIASNAPDDLLMATRDPRALRQKVIQALKITPEQLEEQNKKEEAKKEEEIRKDKEVAKEDELKLDPKKVIPLTDPTPPERTSLLVDKMNRKPKETDKPPNLPTDLFQPPTSADTKASLDALKERLAPPSPGTASKLADIGVTVGPNEGGRPTDVNRMNGLLDGLPATPVGTFAVDTGAAPSGPLAGDTARDVGRKLTDGRALRTGNVRGKVTGMKSATKVSGSLDPGQVYDVIDKSIGKIQACYEGRLRVDATLAGRITFRWTVTASGSVSGVQQTASTVADPEVATCIKRVLQVLRFPKPDGGVVEISYPFIFRGS